MQDDRVREALRRYAASLTPEERAEFARALLGSKKGAARPATGSPVPQHGVWASRVAATGITGYSWAGWFC